MNTEYQPILLDTAIDDDHHNNGDDEEEEKDNIDRCMALSHPFCQLCLLLSSSIRIFTDIGGRETGEISSRHHTASGTENNIFDNFGSKCKLPVVTLTVRIISHLSVL